MTYKPNDPAGTVISLGHGRPKRKSNAIALVDAYWTALRDGPGIPKRSDVHPSGLSDVLEHIFILERIAPGVARFRIAGATWTQLTGMEVRGMPISAFFKSPRRAEMASAIEACCAPPARVEASVTARSVQRGPDVQGRMLLLPLYCEAGRANRILGAIDLTGPVTADAYRIELSDVTVRSVLGGQPTHVEDGPPPVTGGKAPHLRLVYSNETV